MCPAVSCNGSDFWLPRMESLRERPKGEVGLIRRFELRSNINTVQNPGACVFLGRCAYRDSASYAVHSNTSEEHHLVPQLDSRMPNSIGLRCGNPCTPTRGTRARSWLSHAGPRQRDRHKGGYLGAFAPPTPSMHSHVESGSRTPCRAAS